LTLAALLLSACAAPAAPTAAPAASATVAPTAAPKPTSAPPVPTTAGATPASATAKPTAAAVGDTTTEADALAQLYSEAKKEGTVQVYTATTGAQIEPFLKAFEAKYPGVKAPYLRLSTAEMIQRFSSERASGVNAADVLTLPDPLYLHDAVTSGDLVSLAKARLPGGFPPKDFPASFVAFDGEFGSNALNPYGIEYNSKLASGNDVPRSFEALLDAKWSGQITAIPPTQGGAGIYDFFHFLSQAYGDAFLEKFKAQMPKWLLPVPGTQAVGAGEFAIAVPGFAALHESLKASGAPVGFVVPDVTSGTGAFVGLPAKAPHPNAARLLVQFAFSKEGANKFCDFAGVVSPYGGGQSSMPKEFKPAQTQQANGAARKAELDRLLGL
jgi:iron(III) transport system substrate-binding protein